MAERGGLVNPRGLALDTAAQVAIKSGKGRPVLGGVSETGFWTPLCGLKGREATHTRTLVRDVSGAGRGQREGRTCKASSQPHATGGM